jgi:V8-like Glu-specific endopeptidase
MRREPSHAKTRLNATGTLLREHARKLAMLAVLLPGTASCSVTTSEEDTGASQEGTQCGPTWDAQDVELYNGQLGVPFEFVSKHQRPVGFQVDEGCSGTLVSRDLFLSAAHCLYEVNTRVDFDFQRVGNPNVFEIREPRSFFVQEVVEEEFSLGNFDYSLLRLSGSPGDTFRQTPIINRDQAAGSLITLIGHPDGVPKVVNTGNLLDFASPNGANWFRHQADTAGGSSGAGVLSGDGFLVGVHTNAGCNNTEPIGGNQAMRMSALISHSPRLRALANGDIPLTGDFDSDGQVDDLGIWRPSDGTWHALRSDSSVIFSGIQWGQQEDVPLVGDFDGDGRFDDMAVWRPADGTWHARRRENSVIYSGLQWGQRGDIPLAADFDGDGQLDDLAVFRPADGTWHARRSSDTVIFSGIVLGGAGDYPLAGDFDSDGFQDDMAIWRPSTGAWFAIRTNQTLVIQRLSMGGFGDYPMTGDFDSDGQVDDIAIWTPTTGIWQARRRDNSVIFGSIQWGQLGDLPVVGDFDSDGRRDDVGVWRSSDGHWHARRRENSVIFNDIEWGAPH